MRKFKIHEAWDQMTVPAYNSQHFCQLPLAPSHLPLCFNLLLTESVTSATRSAADSAAKALQPFVFAYSEALYPEGSSAACTTCSTAKHLARTRSEFGKMLSSHEDSLHPTAAHEEPEVLANGSPG